MTRARGQFWWLSVVLLAFAGCRSAPPPAKTPETDGENLAPLLAAMEAVRPLHQRMGPAQEGDWLDVYGELGQSFEEYRHSQPHLARGERRVIYVLPVGRFTPAQERIIGLAAAYMRRFFNLRGHGQTSNPAWRSPAGIPSRAADSHRPFPAKHAASAFTRRRRRADCFHGS